MNQNITAMLAMGAGICIACQAAANSRLREVLQVPGIWAGYLSILGTLVVTTVAMLILRPATPTMVNLKAGEWWNWLGGPLGALIVLSGTLLVQHLGAAMFIALVVAGQLLASLILDHFALMGLPEQELTWKKAIGALLIIAGVLAMKYWK